VGRPVPEGFVDELQDREEARFIVAFDEFQEAASDDVAVLLETPDDGTQCGETQASRSGAFDLGEQGGFQNIQVDVEIHLAHPSGEHPSSEQGWVRLERFGADEGDPGFLDVVVLGWIQLPGPGQQDLRWPKPGEGNLAEGMWSFFQQAAQGHAVEKPAGRGVRGVQVTVRIQPDHGQFPVVPAVQPRNRNQLDAAISSQGEDAFGSRIQDTSMSLSLLPENGLIAEDPFRGPQDRVQRDRDFLERV
jgi:hypothetical protein